MVTVSNPVARLSEGFCPATGHGRLALVDGRGARRLEAGWCPSCEVWWRVECGKWLVAEVVARTSTSKILKRWVMSAGLDLRVDFPQAFIDLVVTELKREGRTP